MEYQIQLIPLALSLLSKITDKRIQQEIRKRIEKLKIEPDKQGDKKDIYALLEKLINNE